MDEHDADDGPTSWEDMIVAERMAADRDFQGHVMSSSFSNQTWGLVMMAVEFDILHPEDPEQAEFEVNLDAFDSVLPAMKKLEFSMNDPGETSFMAKLEAELRTIFRRKQNSEDRRREAESLANEYALVLRHHLVESGKWKDVCAIVADEA